MAVAIDAQGTLLVGTTLVLTTGNYTGLTVGATANALVVVLATIPAPAAAPTVHWDTAGANQLMTLIGTGVDTTNINGKLFYYGLLSPSTGNKTLTATWVTTSARFGVNAISFTGAATTFAAAFTNFATTDNTTSSTSITQALTYSNTGNSVGLSVWLQGGTFAVSTRSDTLWFNGAIGGVGMLDGQTQSPSSGSSHNFNLTTGSASFWITNVVEISPPAALPAALVDGTRTVWSKKSQRRPQRTGAALLASPPPTVTAAPPTVTGGTLPFMGVG